MVYQVPPSSFQPERQISSVSARFSPRTSSFKKMNLKEPYVRKKKKKISNLILSDSFQFTGMWEELSSGMSLPLGKAINRMDVTWLGVHRPGSNNLLVL